MCMNLLNIHSFLSSLLPSRECITPVPGPAGRRFAAGLCLYLGLGLFAAAALTAAEPDCAGPECGAVGEDRGGAEGLGAPASADVPNSLPDAACAPGVGRRPPEIPPRLGIVLNQAQQRMGEGRNEDAVRLLQDYLRKNPQRDHVILEFLLGNALYALERPGEALDAYRKAVRLEPCYGPAWVNLGQAALEQEKYPLAAEAFVRGHALVRPENPEYLYYGAVAHVLDGRHEEAVVLLEALPGNLTGRPNPEWARTLLHAYMERGRNAQAEALLDRLLASFPDNPDFWRYAYRFEANRRNYEKAVVNLVVLGYLTELTREERLLLGDLYSAIHVPLAASEQYERALQDEASVSEVERLAFSYLAAHRAEVARRTLQQVVADRPSARLWLLLGEIRFMEEDYPGAFDAFRESARLDAAGGRAHLMTGYSALQMHRKADAVRALREAAKYPQHKEDARRLLEQAERMEPGGRDPSR